MAKTIDVGPAGSLGHGQTRKFRFEDACGEREGFVVRWQGRLYAYINECRHIPLSLDWTDNRFFSRDGRYLQCATHGALYEVETGRCVAGPPAGLRLQALPVTEAGGRILVTTGQ
ncbi:MAG: Rieske (2Fe-2S) protein [Candidatus Dadabacteria bacterium]|nr:MAG: Rieske (2Fe-2S) protein [Candidatus Dadabacteria bacterium]